MSRSTRAKLEERSAGSAPLKPTVVVATSGGADSGAALLLARESMPDVRLFAVYIDHGIRPRKRIAADVAAVRAQARHARAKVVVRKIAVPRRGVSLEAAARERRYAELARVAQGLGADTVITGHHRDDVAETALLALVRGSGLDGLSAMNERMALARGVTLVRPLLPYGKQHLIELLRAAGVPYATDETNEDLRLRRNALRALLSELERVVPGASRSIARSAALLAGDKRVLQSLAVMAFERARADDTSTDLSVKALRALPPALLRRVLRVAVRRSLDSLVDFDSKRCVAIANAIGRAEGGLFPASRGTHVELSAGRLSFHKGLATTRSRAALPESTIVVPHDSTMATDTAGRISMRLQAKNPGNVAVEFIRPSTDVTLIGADELPPGTTLTLRTPRSGDKCIPSGRHRPVPLRKFLAKSGVPNRRRDETLLLCRGPEIIAAIGVRVMEPHVPRGSKVLVVNTMKAASG